MIEINDLSKSFGSVWVVDSVNLTINEGETFGLLGPNGAGKTTLIRMLCTLLRPSKGTVLVNGLKVGNADDEIRKLIGLVPEFTGLYDRLTAIENLRFHNYLHEIPRKTGEHLIEEYLNRMGLWEHKNRPVGTFSKGMKQRLAIARALIHQPRIIFLDEPTSGLDAVSAKEVRDMIKGLELQGTTIVLCTHNMDEAQKLCKRVAVFKHKILKVLDLSNIGQDKPVTFTLTGLTPGVLEDLRTLPGIRQIEVVPTGLKVLVSDPESVNFKIVQKLVAHGCLVNFIQQEQTHLEDVYLELVGHGVEK